MSALTIEALMAKRSQTLEAMQDCRTMAMQLGLVDLELWTDLAIIEFIGLGSQKRAMESASATGSAA